LSLAAAPDGKTWVFFATAASPLTNHPQLRFLNLATGRVVARDLDTPGHVIWSLAYSPDGRFLADAGAADNLARLWEPTQRRVRTLLKGHGQDTAKVRVSPDGKRLATTSLDRTVRVWDPATGQELSRQSDVWASSGLGRGLGCEDWGRPVAVAASREDALSRLAVFVRRSHFGGGDRKFVHAVVRYEQENQEARSP
jgi:WD40 repeat protein